MGRSPTTCTRDLYIGAIKWRWHAATYASGIIRVRLGALLE
jgi:hypothetical protein